MKVSSFEFACMVGAANGLTFGQIGNRLDRSVKSVYRALLQAKLKTKSASVPELIERAVKTDPNFGGLRLSRSGYITVDPAWAARGRGI